MRYIDSYNIFESKHNSDIVDALQNGYCEFYYRKQNGKKRHAFGTLVPEFLDIVWTPSEDGEEKDNPDYVVYWDIARKNFRQFEKDSFIKLENVEDSLSDFIEKYPDLEDKVKLAKKKLKEKPKKKESEEKEDSKDDKDKKEKED